VANLSGAQSVEEIQSRIRAFASAHPELSWVEGRGWGLGAFGGSAPTRAQLDAVSPNRPAVMRSGAGHTSWVNSKALAAAGITRATPDPPNGVIERDSNGEPTGWLKERPAMTLVNRVMPQPTQDDRRRMMRAAIGEAHRFGVTSVTDASGTPEGLALLDDLRRRGELTLRVNYSLLVEPVKMFLDGVIQAETAFLLAPYGAQRSVGAPVFARDEFERIVAMLDRRGWQIMVHSLGDGAVRMALDTFERVAAANPPPARGRRHRIEHLVLIDPADMPRFAKLGVIANFQPTPGFLPSGPGKPLASDHPPRDGARWKAVREAGGRVAFGSDWPVSSLNAMTRVYGIANGPRIDRRLPPTAIIDGYTREAAYAAFDDTRVGTIAVGKLADVVILATDVFTHAPTKADDVAVAMTIFDGRVVYRARQ
jgi:predicted amidohydrolase YtcJ